MCEQYGIEPHTLMREAANPLADYVSVMHSSYTPSWEYAIGGAEEQPLPDPPAEGDDAPSSAPVRSRVRTFRRRPKPVPRKRKEVEERVEEEPEPDPELEDMVAKLRNRRAEADRRMAAVRLAEQRRHQQSIERELHDERTRHAAERRALDKQAKMCEVHAAVPSDRASPRVAASPLPVAAPAV